ncbi:LamG-like jellyroll fold domain-containing protein [Geotalea uraniireducens]|uniref:non-specific serine/threonine protein kinase n=1 Tax=Geotalea uraniireducens (strain Rf4) TaxID=351605 RepID=A5GAT0_GEOUR|nr:LamG-like jellyroll fold domain-containing protein [Geotalea uraniireducens]ABQ25318.1 LamG domain protein jellyroll fold domain protein [Geotalea uraniireducens Rf4]
MIRFRLLSLTGALLLALVLPPAGQVFAAAPTNGLVAWYPFNANANDASGTGNNGNDHAGTISGPSRSALDQFGRTNHAYFFDGSYNAFDFITVPDSPSLSFTNGFSASLWVNFTAVNDLYFGYDFQSIFTKDNFNSLGLMLRNSDHLLLFYHAGLSQPYSQYSWSDVQPGVWYNVTITYDGSSHTTRFFINGTEKSATAVTGTLTANSLPLIIGADNVNGLPYPFTGKLDSIRFYNRALSAAEVLAIYNDDKQLPTSVEGGELHSCGVKPDGSVACWGDNSKGQAPAVVAGPFTLVSAGESHTCGVKTDGTVACWGLNSSGQAPVAAIGPLSKGIVGTNFSQGLTVNGGKTPYTFTIVSGTLPPGLGLSASGTLSGASTTVGTYSFTVRVLDATGLIGNSQNLQMTVKYGSAAGVASNLNPAVYGPAITFTATVTATPPGAAGTVTFKEGATPICSGVTISGVSRSPLPPP